MTTEQIRIRLTTEEMAQLKKLAQSVGLSPPAVMTVVASAGLKACVEAGNRLPLPMKFEIVEGPNLVTKSRR